MYEEIAQLEETKIEKFERTFKVKHQMIFMMIDDKVLPHHSSSCNRYAFIFFMLHLRFKIVSND